MDNRPESPEIVSIDEPDKMQEDVQYDSEAVEEEEIIPPQVDDDESPEDSDAQTHSRLARNPSKLSDTSFPASLRRSMMLLAPFPANIPIEVIAQYIKGYEVHLQFIALRQAAQRLQLDTETQQWLKTYRDEKMQMQKEANELKRRELEIKARAVAVREAELVLHVKEFELKGKGEQQQKKP
ncbi:hypothetical protein R3P38DRAFT_3171656 [Favolaschia claudopus]|uniref:Uncharacterized protein n=1 Tax=Favolaschia claudopus TaxID=2862362 RepID=A0AAW0DRB0_9AGAR